jgi:hypothetical protein
MKKIIKYRIAYGESLKDMEEKVNNLINKGYTPFGNFQFAATPETMLGEYSLRLYFQTMVKYDKDKE